MSTTGILQSSATFLWIGFVGAISFMESWLKFRAPGVSLPVGLGIGRLVFNALNKMEWVFAIAIIAGFAISKPSWNGFQIGCLAVPLVLLVLQTFWLLPSLDARAQARIEGRTPPSSRIHVYYVAAEVLKIASLSTFGIFLFN